MTTTYRYEPHRRTEVTIFSFGGSEARAGAKATRYFKRVLARGEAEGVRVAEEAFRRSDEARARWPEWPRPTGLDAGETELTLLAFLLADGWPESRIDGVVATGGRGF